MTRGRKNRFHSAETEEDLSRHYNVTNLDIATSMHALEEKGN
jgi:hypothetical protein